MRKNYLNHSILIAFIIIALSFTNAIIDPVLDAQRRKILPEFLMKVTGTREAGLNNLTLYATPNYCWNIEYSGSFCQPAASDYVSILFVQVPYFNTTSNTLQYFQLAYGAIQILELDLFNDGLLNDTYVIKYIYNNSLLNTTTFQYDTQAGLFYTAYYTFLKGSALVKDEVVKSEDFTKIISSATAYASVTQICTVLVGIPNYLIGTCPVGSVYQQYSSMEDCVTKLTAVDNMNLARKNGPCPDYQVSNTTACRNLHTFVTLTDPPTSQAIHCPHTGTPSTVCIDRCNDVCNNCSIDGHCEFRVSIYGVRSYQCVCNDGYIGDGRKCVAKPCSADYECGKKEYFNFAYCNTSSQLCQCEKTFKWNAITARCECQGNSTVHYVNGNAICIPLGRCLSREYCSKPGENSDGIVQTSIGEYNSLKCTNYGSLNELFPYPTCVCNYGYTGGFYIPCTCNKRIEWSQVIQGNVCLDSNECTQNTQCGSSTKYCDFGDSPSLGVGRCKMITKKKNKIKIGR